MPPCKGDENMYCTVKEIIREVLEHRRAGQ